MIVIGTTRKPTQRLRSFIKELARGIPGAKSLTRGKQGFSEFCDSATNLGASGILLVGAFHGNPGRIGFLKFSGETWEFYPPTLIIKSTRLLRETNFTPPRKILKLYVLSDTPRDQVKAQMLASALNVTCLNRDKLPDIQGTAALLRVGLSRYKSIDFSSPDEKLLLGPALTIKHFLTRPMGDQNRW